MKEVTNELGRYHSVIITKHVFLEDNQVFVKGDSAEPPVQEHEEEVWYPINFQWIPVLMLRQNLKRQPTRQ